MVSEPNKSRGLPNWVSALILLLVLAGGGWGAWRYFEGSGGALSPAAAATLTDGNVDGPALPRPAGQRPPNMRQFTGRMALNMPDGIMPAGNAFLIKSGTARLDISAGTGRGRGDWRYRFSYAIANIESPEQTRVFQAARRATNDPAAAQKLGATAEQIQQIRNLPNPGMAVDASERANINTLFRRWLSASGRPEVPSAATSRPTTLPAPTPEATAAENQLLKALGDIGNRQLAVTRQSYSDRAGRIRAILGDGLLQKL